MKHLAALFFDDGESLGNQAPIFFDFTDFRSLRNGSGEDGLNEAVDKHGLLLRRTRHLLDLQRKKRIVERTAANHDIGDSGVSGADAVVIGHKADIAIVDNWVIDERIDLGERLHVGHTRILLPTGAGMKGDAFERIVIEDGDETENLVGTVVAKSHLNRELRTDVGNHTLKHLVHLVGVRKDARTAVLASHTAHGAADIPIDLGIAQFEEPIGQLNKLGNLVSKNLRNNGNGTHVGLGKNVGNLLQCIFEIAMSEREKRTDSEVESARETVVVDLAKKQFGEPLHGCENEHGYSDLRRLDEDF